MSEDRGWLGTLPLAIRRELGRLLPEAEPGDGGSAAPPEYMKLFEGVGLLLGHVTARQPTVLILEDVHWADEMSVRLLAFIGRRLKGWRLLLLVTARAEDLVEAPMLQADSLTSWTASPTWLPWRSGPCRGVTPSPSSRLSPARAVLKRRWLA